MIDKILDDANNLSLDEKNQLLCDLLGGMDSKELRGVVETAEETFGVKVPEPFNPEDIVRVTPPEVEEEPTEFDVFIQNSGEKKIHVIKELRGLSGLGLRDAKTAVESLNAVGLNFDAEKAQKWKDQLEGAGATVILRPAANNL